MKKVLVVELDSLDGITCSCGERIILNEYFWDKKIKCYCGQILLPVEKEERRLKKCRKKL